LKRCFLNSEQSTFFFISRRYACGVIAAALYLILCLSQAGIMPDCLSALGMNTAYTTQPWAGISVSPPVMLQALVLALALQVKSLLWPWLVLKNYGTLTATFD